MCEGPQPKVRARSWRQLGIVSVAGVVLSLILGLFIGVSGFTFYYGEGWSYMSDDPKACVNCHIMREHYDGWQKASHHAAATCNDCHIPHDNAVNKWVVKADNGFWHSKGFTFQDFHEPIRIRESNSVVLQENCLRCHADFVHDIAPSQFEEYDPRGCVRCHTGVGHGPTR